MRWQRCSPSRLHPALTYGLLALILAAPGCNYSSTGRPGLPTAKGAGKGKAIGSGPSNAVIEQKTAILENVVRQIDQAAINPGGPHFFNAVKNLNQYFAGTPAAEYKLSPKTREFLTEQMGKDRVNGLEVATWELPDARHIEDCMLYQGIATRAAGTGDDVTRVRRVFDWMVRQVQLVPAGSLAGQGGQQAQARPFDVLLRGFATEAGGVWSERGWLFLSLCRQLGLDAGLVIYTPPKLKEPVVWCVAVLIDGKAYLFDPRLGLAIPDAKGTGVATLDEALADPSILDRMDLPGQDSYNTTRDVLLASPSKIGILIDSSPRYFSPRMRLLQERLAGKNLTVLYRDPVEQRDKFAAALGDHFGKLDLWQLPLLVETMLFTNPQFVEATQRSLFLFRPEFPLLMARMKQLRGEVSEAIRDYVSMRFAENAMLLGQPKGKERPIPPEIQQALDAYSTYFLGTCHLDQNDVKHAEFFFDKTMTMLPDVGRGQPSYNMFRWGAQSNLGRIKEAKGETEKATAYYCLPDPTTQRLGNLIRARELSWADPFGRPTPPLAPPPAPTFLRAAPPPESPGEPAGLFGPIFK